MFVFLHAHILSMQNFILRLPLKSIEAGRVRLFVPIMSRTRFRVNLHSIFA